MIHPNIFIVKILFWLTITIYRNDAVITATKLKLSRVHS